MITLEINNQLPRRMDLFSAIERTDYHQNVKDDLVLFFMDNFNSKQNRLYLLKKISESSSQNIIVLQHKMKATLGGKTYDIPSFQRSENYPMVCGSETGDLLVQVGDWGTMAPTYEINEVTENADQTRTVSVDYYSFDYENDEQSDVLATATYTFTPNSDSTFGYAITDMKFTQK